MKVDGKGKRGPIALNICTLCLRDHEQYPVRGKVEAGRSEKAGSRRRGEKRDHPHFFGEGRLGKGG